jgi:hypothetical protein
MIARFAVHPIAAAAAIRETALFSNHFCPRTIPLFI